MNTEYPTGRVLLSRVLAEAGDIIHINDVVNLTGVSRIKASKTLSRWTKQGWLRRVARGVYTPANLDLLELNNVLEDPWVMVPTFFNPGYITGRTALEYWELTEQIFRDIVVKTATHVRKKTQNIHGTIFTIYHVSDENLYGTKILWRLNTPVSIADPHKTIVDVLDKPELGGGIQHVNDCFINYLSSNHCDLEILLEYGDRLGNGALFKRLGFLGEREGLAQQFLDACKVRLTKGYAQLDSNLSCPRIVTKWKLRVPESWIVGRSCDK